MGWSVGFDPAWQRDIGYGVPAWCDHPDCNKDIDRGLAYVCGGEPYGGDAGCGLYFCSGHLGYVLPKGDPSGEWSNQLCDRCAEDDPAFDPKPDRPEWVNHKLADDSWAKWRDENPYHVAALRATNP